MGRRLIEVQSVVEDVSDWVRASYASEVPDYAIKAIVGGSRLVNLPAGADLITRRFSPDMSLSTVLKLSEEWHHAVAEHGGPASVQFPEPWCDGGVVDGYGIRPLRNSAALYLEGRSMHHCVNAFANDIANGESFIYSITKDGERVATLELARRHGKAQLGQLRGPCNSIPPKSVEAVVRKWWRNARKAVRLPEPPSRQYWSPPVAAVFAGDDEEIPF